MHMDCSHIHTLFDIFHNADSLLILRLMYLSLTLLSCEILNKNLLGNFFTGVIVKQPFFDPLRDEALYDDGEFWEVSVVISVFERASTCTKHHEVQHTWCTQSKNKIIGLMGDQKKMNEEDFSYPSSHELPLHSKRFTPKYWLLLIYGGHNFVVQLMNLNGWKVVGMFKRSPYV